MKSLRLWISTAAAVMAFGLVSCGDDNDEPDNGGDNNGEGEMAVYTPEQSKEFLQQTATEFLNLFNPNDQKSIIELAAYFEGTYGDYDLPDQFDVEDGNYNPASYMKSLGRAMKGDLDALTSAAYTYTYNIYFDRFAGIYEPDSRNEEWVLTGKSDDVIFKFNDSKNAACELRVTKAGSTSDFSFSYTEEDYWYSEEYIYNLSIPHTLTATLKQGGATLATTKVTSKIDIKGHTLEANAEASAANVDAKAVVTGNDSKIECSAEFSMNGAPQATTYATVNGSGLCDRDKIENLINNEFDRSDMARMFSNGSCKVNALDKVQVYGQVTYNNDLYDAFDETYWDYYDYATQAQARAECQKACDTINKYVKAQLRYNNTATDQATVGFQPYLDSWAGGSMWEYYIEPVLQFSDNTTYSFEEYFKNFNTVENKWNVLTNAYKKLWDSAYPNRRK